MSNINDRTGLDLDDEDDRKAQREVFECIAGDLPDGAYMAMMEEFDLDVDDFIDEEDLT